MTKTMKKGQKLYIMKGCSKQKSKRNLGGKSKKIGGKNKKRNTKKHVIKRGSKQRGGNCGCGIQLGGCSSCLTGGVQLQTGGGIGYIGSPTYGKPYSSEMIGLPGVAGNDGQTNFYSLNKYDKPYLQTQQISERDQQTYIKGGSRKRNAGGIIPQDLVNLGRSMVYGAGSAYNSLNGYPAPASPLPFQDQYATTSSYKSLGI